MAEDAKPERGELAAQMAVAGGSDEAREFLRKQSRLTELQIADLEREDRLRHWSLRVHHISDVMKLAFEFAVAAILLGLVALLAGVVWDAAHDNGLVIESFSMPPDLVQRGITGQVVASKVLDKLNAMQAATNSNRAASSYANNWGNDIKVEIPDTGVSIGEFVRYLDAWLGHQTHIAGDVYRTDKGYAVTARVGSTATPTFTGGDLDALVSQAATAIYRATQPYRYAMYLWSGRAGQFGPPAPDSIKGLTLLHELAATGDTEDRAWAADAIGDYALFQGDPAGNLRWLDQSIAIEPGVDALMDFTRVYAILEQDEQTLHRSEAAVAFGRHGGGTRMAPEQRAADLLYARQISAVLRGDDVQALELAKQLEPLTGVRVTVGPYNKQGKIYACAALHDAVCVDRVNSIDPLPPVILLRANVALGRYKEAAGEEAVARDYLIPLYKFGQILALRDLDPNLAMAKAKLGDFTGANALIGPTPSDCDLCMRMRGRIAALERHYDEAARDFAIVAARSPDIPFADTDWGRMLLQRGDYDGAIAKFASANRVGPRFADPLEMWGEALMLKNRSDLALAKFAEAAKYAPNWGHLHLMWGEALFYAGKKNEAKKQFAIAAALDLTPSEKTQLARAAR